MGVASKDFVPLIFALVAPIVPAILLLASQASFGSISDLPEYYAAAKMILAGQGSHIYSPADLAAFQRDLFPSMGDRCVLLYVPPFALPWLFPLSLLPVQAVQLLWPLLLLLAFIGSLIVLRAVFRLRNRSLLYLWAVLVISGPLYESLRIGQLAPLLLLAFSGCLWALEAKRPMAAGLALGFLLLKPQEILPFLAYLAGARRYRVLIGLGIVALVLAGISLTMIGQNGYVAYLDLLRDSIENSAPMQPELQPNLRGQLLRVWPEQKLAIASLSSGLAALTLVFIFFCGRKFGRRRQWLLAGLLLALPLGLVTAPFIHDYDLLLVVPSAVALSQSSLVRKLPAWAGLTLVLLTPAFLLPAYVFIHYNYLLKGAVLNPLFLLILIFACGLVWLVIRNPEELD